jgi:hypothetical protein
MARALTVAAEGGKADIAKPMKAICAQPLEKVKIRLS